MALEGFLQEFGLADILQLIYYQKKTGILLIEGKADKIKIKFKDGNLISLESRKRTESKRIGKILITKGLINQNDLIGALETQKREGTPIGSIFMKRGLVPGDILTQVIEDQITESIAQFFAWKEGRYEFVPQEIPLDEELPISLDTQHLLMGGVKKVDELSVVEGRLDLDAVYKKIREPKSEELSEAEQVVFKLIDGDSDVSTIITISHLEDFETSKAILSLEERGLIEPVAVVPLMKKEKEVFFEVSKPLVYAATFGIALIISLFVIKGNYDAFEIIQTAEGSMKIERLKDTIDIYSLSHGRYPESLEPVTQEKDSWGWPYIYKLTERGYILFSVGPDGVQGTEDDVY